MTGMKYFSKVWITGSSNQKTSNIFDHATSEQHRAVMVRVRADADTASNQAVSSYSPLTRSLLVTDETVTHFLSEYFHYAHVLY